MYVLRERRKQRACKQDRTTTPSIPSSLPLALPPSFPPSHSLAAPPPTVRLSVSVFLPSSEVSLPPSLPLSPTHPLRTPPSLLKHTRSRGRGGLLLRLNRSRKFRGGRRPLPGFPDLAPTAACGLLASGLSLLQPRTNDPVDSNSPCHRRLAGILLQG